MSDSLITKKAIAGALKTVCKEKAFDKISIADITAACGLNRQTFYYHFQDKYELLSWIYYNENFSLITEDISFENWNEKIFEMLRMMVREKAFYMNTLKEQEKTFESYLFDMAKALFLDALELLDVGGKLAAAEKEFDAEFYAFGICGVIMSWAERGMKIAPEVVSLHLKSLASDTGQIAHIRNQALQNMNQDK